MHFGGDEVFVFIVDDEKLIVKGLRFSLEQENMKVDCAYDGEEAVEMARNNQYDIILLDVMLPKLTGYEVCQLIREFSRVPVIMLTAKGDDMDKILGLEYGADDYITKPYSPKELVLRVNNIIKRVYGKTENTLYEGYNIDLDKRCIYENDKEIVLTTLEFDLFMLFFKNKDKCFSREEILASVWGSDYFGSDRVVDDLVRRVRKKLPKLNLNAIYGYGYRML